MNKIETKNLLRNQTCDTCKWLQSPDWKNEYCFVQSGKKLSIPDSRTCEEWCDVHDKYFKLKLQSEKEVRDFFKNGRTFDFKTTDEIEGIEVYYEPTRELIYENKFQDGPYIFSPKGGSLTVKACLNQDTIEKITMGL